MFQALHPCPPLLKKASEEEVVQIHPSTTFQRFTVMLNRVSFSCGCFTDRGQFTATVLTLSATGRISLSLHETQMEQDK